MQNTDSIVLTEEEKEYKYNEAKYCMMEYPAHLLNEWENRAKSDFLKKRIGSLKFTTNFYWIVLGFLAVQVVFLIFGGLVRNYNVHSLHILWFKFLAFLFWLGSFIAWKRQLWKDEEFYGLALANYSKDEPIYRTLAEMSKKLTDVSTSNVLIGDWLRNRPSIVFLVAISFSSLYLDCIPFPYTGWTFASCVGYEVIPVWQWTIGSDFWTRLLRVVIQLVLSTILYAISFPIRTDWAFVDLLPKKTHKSERVKLFIARLVLWSILVLLPVCFTVLTAGYEWIGIAFIKLLVVAVYLFLLCLSKHNKRKKEHSDGIIINALQKYTSPSDNKRVYFSGQKNDDDLATTENEAQAADVYLEKNKDGEGYNLYVKDGEKKVYIMVTQDPDNAKKARIDLGEKPGLPFTYNETYKTFEIKKGNNIYYLGCHRTTTTISVSNIKCLFEEKGDLSQFPERLVDLENKIPYEVGKRSTEFPYKVGEAYKFKVEQNNASVLYSFTQLSSKGQIQFLNWLQTQSFKNTPILSFIKGFKDGAHTPQVLDLILDIEDYFGI